MASEPLETPGEAPVEVSGEAPVEVSVVVPARDAAATLPDQLAALARQETPRRWEVIVVDAGSRDETAAVAHDHAHLLPRLRLVRASHPLWPGAARNLGVRHARGERLLFCDADDVVAAGWLEALAAALDRDGVVAGARDAAALNPAWVQATRDLGQRDGLRRWDNPPWLLHAGAGNLAIRRELFERVGGFDERFATLEDAALCFAAQLAGASIGFEPDAVVAVRMRADLLGVYRQGRAWGEASVLVHRVFADAGLPRPARLRPLAGWVAAPLRLLTVHGRADLARWLHRHGWRVGRLRGSLRHRRLAL